MVYFGNQNDITEFEEMKKNQEEISGDEQLILGDWEYNSKEAVQNDIINIDVINKFTKLRILYLRGVQLTTLDGYQAVKQIKIFYIAGCNKIINFEFLKQCDKVETFLILNMTITNVDMVLYSKSLKTLHINHNYNITDFSALSKCTGLTRLSSQFTNISDISPIVDLKNLGTLYLVSKLSLPELMIFAAITIQTAFPYQQLYETLINIPDMTWTPHIPQQPMSVEQIKAKLTYSDINPMRVPKFSVIKEAPSSINWATKDPACVDVIRDQGECGSCWAFAAIAVFSDRRCIEKKDAQRVQYSEQFVVSCDKVNMGCNGGYSDPVWNFLQTEGTFTDECLPYISGQSGKKEKCFHTCEDGHVEDPVKSKGYQDVCAGEEVIMGVVAEGPITTNFQVYEDFMLYKAGIYKHQTGQKLGGHSVEIIGYGIENDIKYWIVKNSWGQNWAEKGYFRIVKGVNECNCENQCIAPLK